MAQEIEVTDANIELHEDDEYALHAYGTLKIDGPLGTLEVRKSYRAAPKYDGLMAEDEIDEHIDYYHHDSKYYPEQSYTDAGVSWTPHSEDVLEDEQAFLEECEAAMLGDPGVEYEEALRGARLGIGDALEDAYAILMASDGRIGLTEAQAEAYALREMHDVPRKWASIALGKDPSNVDNLQRNARKKVDTIQRVSEAVESAQ